MTATKYTDTEMLDFLLDRYIVDVVDSFTTPLDPNPPPETIRVFDIGVFQALRPLHLEKDLRETIQRAMEEERKRHSSGSKT